MEFAEEQRSVDNWLMGTEVDNLFFLWTPKTALYALHKIVQLFSSHFNLPKPITNPEKCALVGYYAASGGNSLPTFRDSLESWPLKMYRLSRNVGKELPLHTAQ